jgi:hypothetical protein
MNFDRLAPYYRRMEFILWPNSGREAEQEGTLVTAVSYCIKLSSRPIQLKSLTADFLVVRHCVASRHGFSLHFSP